MESEKILPLPDGKKLYYVHTTGTQPRDKVVVHIHGLSGWPHGVAQTAMARRFPALGYDVVRPCLYHWEEGARVLHETTIAINAADVEVLIDELQKTYKKIFVVGHSYGGPCTMALRQDRLTAVSLWDPTYVPGRMGDDAKLYQKVGDQYSFTGSFYFLISEEFKAERIAYDHDRAVAVSKQWHIPLQLVHAQDGLWAKYNDGESFHTYATGPTERLVIAGTSHCFHEEGTTEQLLDAVQAWFDKF